MNWNKLLFIFLMRKEYKIIKLFFYFQIFLIFLFAYFAPLYSETTNSNAIDVCGRSAIVNYQEVFVETTGNNKKGEGLRYYLEKDSIAKDLLDEYQEKNGPKWQDAAIGTLGTALFFFGLGNSGNLNDNTLSSRRNYMIAGITILVLNFLVIRTKEYNNEKLLLRSIEEYNKRNFPKIYFSPYENRKKEFNNDSEPNDWGFMGGFIKDF